MFFFLFPFGIFSDRVDRKHPIDPIKPTEVPPNVFMNYSDIIWTKEFTNRFTQAYVHCYNTEFQEVYNPLFGGAIYATYSQLVLNRTKIISCQACMGGGIFLLNGDLIFNDGRIEKTTAYYMGGGICMLSTKSDILQSHLIPNSPFASDYHFAFIYRSTFSFTISYFAFGGILLDHVNNIVIDGCSFFRGETIFTGGAIGIIGPTNNNYDEEDEEYTSPIISNCEFLYNYIYLQTEKLNHTRSYWALFSSHTKSYHTNKWLNKNVENRIRKGGAAIAVYNCSYLYTEKCYFYGNVVNNYTNVRHAPGTNVYLHNVNLYYSFNDTVLKNVSNLIGYDFDDDYNSKASQLSDDDRDDDTRFQLIVRFPIYLTTQTQTPLPYKETQTFTPNEIKKVDKVFRTEPIEKVVADQTPYATNPRRTYTYLEVNKYGTVPPLRTQVLRSINPQINPTISQSPKATETVSMSPTASQSPFPTKTPYQVSVIQSLTLTLSWTYQKTVTVTCTQALSYVVVYSYYDGTFVESQSVVFSSSFFPYIINVLTPSYVQTLQDYVVTSNKKKVSPEQLIGYTCGATAAFFLIVAIVIFAVRKKNNMYRFSDVNSTDSSLLNEHDSDGNVAEIAVNMNEISKEPNVDDWL